MNFLIFFYRNSSEQNRADPDLALHYLPLGSIYGMLGSYGLIICSICQNQTRVFMVHSDQTVQLQHSSSTELLKDLFSQGLVEIINISVNHDYNISL